MPYAAEAIRTAIAEKLEDLDGAYAYGAFIGQPLQAQQSMARQTSIGTHWFDVELGSEEPHAATPVGALDPRRVLQVEVTIPIWTHVATTAQESERVLTVAAIASDGDDAAQALSLPGAIDETAAAVATGIVSGLMYGPGRAGQPVWRMVSADWGAQLIRSAITGSLVVAVEA